MSAIKFKTVNPRPLYYGKYSMVFSGDMDYVSYLRSSNDAVAVEQRITNLLSLQLTSVMRLRKINTTIGFTLAGEQSLGHSSSLASRLISDLSLTDTQIAQAFEQQKVSLIALFNELMLLDKTVTRVTYRFNNVKVYANDEQTIERFAILPVWTKHHTNKIEAILRHGEYSRATVEYKYRTYFKPQQVSTEEVNALTAHLSGLGSVRASPALLKASSRHSLHKSKVYLRSHYYIDYNDPTEISFLRLMFPTLLTRTINFVEK